MLKFAELENGQTFIVAETSHSSFAKWVLETVWVKVGGFQEINSVAKWQDPLFLSPNTLVHPLDTTITSFLIAGDRIETVSVDGDTETPKWVAVVNGIQQTAVFDSQLAILVTALNFLDRNLTVTGLIDGASYHLGAAYMRWHKEKGYFATGNVFVPKSKTRYAGIATL